MPIVIAGSLHNHQFDHNCHCSLPNEPKKFFLGLLNKIRRIFNVTFIKAYYYNLTRLQKNYNTPPTLPAKGSTQTTMVHPPSGSPSLQFGQLLLIFLICLCVICNNIYHQTFSAQPVS